MIRNFYRIRLTGSGRAHWYAFIMLLAAGIFSAACSRPRTGAEAAKRAREAMKQVKSWKVRSADRLQNQPYTVETIKEYVCPSRMRETSSYLNDPGARPYPDAGVNLIIDGTLYIAAAKNPKWERVGGKAWNPLKECAAMASGRDIDTMPPLGNWITRSSIEGAQRDTRSGRCQEWQLMPSLIPGEDEIICFGVDDYLPRIYTRGTATIEFFDWNVPIDLEAPKLEEKP